MNKTVAERKATWDSFLNRWPLDVLPDMRLAEYSTAGDKDCFVYWLEALTTDLGSMWGGSAFKFGIYSRKDHTAKESGGGSSYGDKYAWATKYGGTPEEAYATVLDLVIKVAKAARTGDLETVELTDLGNVTKWKIAFLYQDRNAPCVLPIFKLDHLQAVIESKGAMSGAQMHTRLLADRGTKDLLEYGDEVWAEVQKIESTKLSTEAAHEFLKTSSRVSAIKSHTQYIAGFRFENGREIALALDNKVPTFYLTPGEWIDAVGGAVSGVVEYSSDKPRSSNLAANAPTLAQGNAMVKVNVLTMAALINVCDAYEGGDALVTASAFIPIKGSGLMSQIPLNQILYGPPGTGKTYATVDESLAILDSEFLKVHAGDRPALKRRFDQLVKAEQIRFVTFHQSFSYEDFVEGLRADSDEESDGQIRYGVEKGVFQLICESAVELPVSNDGLGVADNPRIWKISIDGTQSSHTRQYCLDHDEARIGWGHVGNVQSAKLQDPVHRLGSNDQSTLYSFANEMQKGDIVLCIRSNVAVAAVGVVSGEYRHELSTPSGVRGDYKNVLPVKWLVKDCNFPILALNGQKRFTLKAVYEMTRFSWPELLSAMLTGGVVLPGLNPVEANHQKKPYVLIIDEINRGNISRIFGELITLIEPSKRLDAEEALDVTLPYSKKRFGVPGNVYLIGTMNTADRSLASLDIALRRRFTFKEMLPQPELLDKVLVASAAGSTVNAGQLLRKLNQRIEVLLDRNHCLGHSYFLPLRDDPSLERLASIFRQQIVPLLQEYFFEDWERIRWVFNDQHKVAEHCFIVRPANSVVELFGAVTDLRIKDNRWMVNDPAFDLIESYVGILKVPA